jgi:hypothetical protein
LPSMPPVGTPLSRASVSSSIRADPSSCSSAAERRTHPTGAHRAPPESARLRRG